MTSKNRYDPITLEVLWNRLISTVNEQAAALMHASFTTVVREAGDLSAGVFDEKGNMLAQAVTGTPGHINTMATCVRHLLKEYPIETLNEGDTLITNDPWLASGHYHDLTIVTPVFFRGHPVGLFANTCHVMDIGGRIFGADATSVFEEGLAIPVMKLVDRGRMNEDLIKIIRANVRTPLPVLGDIHAMVAANEVGGKKLIEMMEDYSMADLKDLSDAIIKRSEKSMRKAIADIPDGTYRHQIDVDGFDTPIVIKLAITIKGDHLTADYTGSSPQSNRGINVVYNYCHAYTTYPIKCSISPEVPNNEGSFRPVTVIAPEGCILNCTRPAPVGARHILGHFLSAVVFGALSHVLPDQVIAEGSQGLWNTQFDGITEDGEPFCYVFFSAGGAGARPNKDGLSATAFPSGIRGVPAEVVENVSPIFMECRELITDSGGAGRFRGGLGQRMVLKVRGGHPAQHSPMYDRIHFPAKGFAGGLNGAKGRFFLDDGTVPHPKTKYMLKPNQKITLELPGGGGFYPPDERDPLAVREDVMDALVSLNQARDVYRVALDPVTMEIDHHQTQRLRSATKRPAEGGGYEKD
ncbi:MAG: hydantoinase B/oxoprolinase family protein [Deltaproteobacteria bacterium]|nr:hydantoinase B/oxoprolinase family protein [Deltaproteobacteria bacterium]MBW2153046.1 hydantoinase B/oxoprolinase family protein [Deltaproteobacteria bacterium]